MESYTGEELILVSMTPLKYGDGGTENTYKHDAAEFNSLDEKFKYGGQIVLCNDAPFDPCVWPWHV